jgi:carbon monoxide dehydrogenase subunit G
VEITGEYPIQAPRAQVWEALNDPDVLRETIPGCETLERTGDNQFQAKIKSRIGPVSATFNCKIELTHLNPPVSYTLAGEGQGGVAGFANGTADVILDEDGPNTLLRYSAAFKIGGKLAQIGSRMVAGATRKTADEFFANFAGLVNAMAMLETMEEGAATIEDIAPAGNSEITTSPSQKPPQPSPAPRADAGDTAAKASPYASPRLTPPATAGSGGSKPWIWLGIGAVVLIVLWLLLF